MKPEARESADAAQVARLLKPPAERELPGSRHRQLKEYLMQEITHEAYETQTSVKPHRSRRRLAYLAAPLSAAGAVAVFVTATGNTGNTGRGNPSHSSGLGAPPGSTAPANAPTTLLGKIADAAASKPLPTVRDDQFVYVESKVSNEVDTQDATGYHQALEPLHLRQIWMSVNNSRTGLLREGGQDLSLSGVSGPDYRYLEALPTDPATLLQGIYAGTGSAGASSSASPRVSPIVSAGVGVSVAASGSASSIPSVVPSSIPQHDIAVALDHGGLTSEWLFNKNTLEYVGEQSVSLTAGQIGPAGTIVDTQIILTRAIVDQAGEVPAK